MMPTIIPPARAGARGTSNTLDNGGVTTPKTLQWPVRDPAARCPCLSGSVYGECCEPFHAGRALAPTAERLMRSRYSAYTFGIAPYILATWHPSTRPASLELDPEQRWYRLDILGSSRGGMLDTTGTVEFRAHYRFGGERGEQHELSEFERVDQAWLYVAAL